MSTIEAILGSIATISGAIYGIFKWITWKTQTTPEQAKEAIDKQVDDEFKKAEETGRPVE